MFSDQNEYMTLQQAQAIIQTMMSQNQMSISTSGTYDQIDACVSSKHHVQLRGHLVH